MLFASHLSHDSIRAPSHVFQSQWGVIENNEPTADDTATTNLKVELKELLEKVALALVEKGDGLIQFLADVYRKQWRNAEANEQYKLCILEWELRTASHDVDKITSNCI